MILAYHNARFTKVAGGGFSEDFAAAAGDDAARWTGDIEAYVREQVLTDTTGGSVNELKQTVVVIPRNLGVTVEPEDTVTFERDGEAVTRRVRQVADLQPVGTLRLYLHDA